MCSFCSQLFVSWTWLVRIHVTLGFYFIPQRLACSLHGACWATSLPAAPASGRAGFSRSATALAGVALWLASGCRMRSSSKHLVVHYKQHHTRKFARLIFAMLCLLPAHRQRRFARLRALKKPSSAALTLSHGCCRSFGLADSRLVLGPDFFLMLNPPASLTSLMLLGCFVMERLVGHTGTFFWLLWLYLMFAVISYPSPPLRRYHSEQLPALTRRSCQARLPCK